MTGEPVSTAMLVSTILSGTASAVQAFSGGGPSSPTATQGAQQPAARRKAKRASTGTAVPDPLSLLTVGAPTLLGGGGG